MRSGTSLPLTRAPTQRWPDVGVHAVGEVHRRRAAREGEDLALGREGVDLVGIEIHLQGREELPRVGDLALPVHELPQPLEPRVVGVGQEPPSLYFQCAAIPRSAIRSISARADLDLERLRRARS